MENFLWKETRPRLTRWAESQPHNIHVQFLEPVNMLPDIVEGTLLMILRWGNIVLDYLGGAEIITRVLLSGRQEDWN